MVKSQGALGAVGARGACGLVPVLMVLSACAYTPAARERAHVHDLLQASPGVVQVSVGCEGAILAGHSLCASVVLKEGQSLQFERLGYGSFSANATSIVVAEAGGLTPRVASCDGVGPPNFHRDAALGHHFHPTLIDVTEAITRAGDLVEEVEYWPRCPMTWEVQDSRGVNYRYCARKKDDTSEPPRPESCAGGQEKN